MVGSGFGGAIVALRLTEAGKSVLVLERGKRYQPGEFPRDVRDTDSVLWRYPRRRSGTGLYDLRFFDALGAVAAAGVGGGSLIYANIHVRPDAVVFENRGWPAGFDRRGLDPYYDKVAEKLAIAPVPPQLRLTKRDVYRAAAERLDREVFDPDQAVSWSGSPGNGRGQCKLVAECEFGCQHGAKNSLDLTYLADAERHGAELRPLSFATHVERGQGGYRVHYRDVATGELRSAHGARVILSAGTLGTNELLLRSRDETQTLPELSPRLGYGYSANGDFLGSIEAAESDLDPWNGPDVTSVIRYFDRSPGFTMAAPTFNRAVMRVVTSLGQGRGRVTRRLANWAWPLFGRAVAPAMRLGLLSRPLPVPWRKRHDPGRTTFLFAIGQDDSDGRLLLKRGRLDLEWDYPGQNAELIERMTQAMEQMGREYGGRAAPLFTWLLFRRITTVHSLGGCHLSDSPDRGVVSPEGEVHGYPGLFVADGSVIPSSIGFHPVMTISAVAELTAERIAASYTAA